MKGADAWLIRLKELRTANNMTQQELSKKSGIPQNTISMIENGQRTNPGVETLYPLCAALGCTLSDMYHPDEKEEDEGA